MSPLPFNSLEWKNADQGGLRGTRYRMWQGDEKTIASFFGNYESVVSHLGPPDSATGDKQILVYHLGRKGVNLVDFDLMDEMNLYLYQAEGGSYVHRIATH